MSKLTVTVTEQVSNVAVTEQVIEVNEATGIGPQGIAGVVSATAPITYNSGTQTVGINAGVANGVATLDSDGKIPTTQLPPLAVNDTFVVASQAAMLALTAQVGDIAVRTDVTKTFILTASPASTLGNWQEILTPPGVTSITATSPLTGGTITSTGSIGLDQTGITAPASGLTGTTLASNVVNSSITKTGLTTSGVVKSTTGTLSTGTVDDTQLTSGVTTTGQASKIVKVGASGIATFNTISAGTVYLSPSGGIVGQTGAGNHLIPLSDGGTLVSTADTGTVTNTMLAGSIAQSKIIAPSPTGYWVKSATYNVGDVVLYDYKTWRCIQAHTGRTTIPNNDTSYWQLQWKDQSFDGLLPLPYAGSAGTGSMDPYPRSMVVSTRSHAGSTSGVFHCTWFQASQTITVSSLTFQITTGQAGGGSAVTQLGIFQPANSSGTIISFPQTTVVTNAYCSAIQTLNTTNTPSWSPSIVGTYTTTLPSSITLTAGQYYGIGAYLYYGTTATTSMVWAGLANNANTANFPPSMFSSNNLGVTYGASGLTVGVFPSVTSAVASGLWARLNA